MRKIVFALALVGCAGGGGDLQPQSLHGKQKCITTIICPDGGVLVQSFVAPYDDPSSNDYDGGSATFTSPDGSSGGGGGGCTSEIFSCDGGSSGGGNPGGGGTPPGCTTETTCTPDDDSDGGVTGPGDTGGCWVTGGGYIVDTDGNDSFGGNAMPMKDGTIRGQWEEEDHGTNDKAHGEASYLYCRHVNEPGPGQPGGKKGFDSNQAYFGGHARWFTPSTGWQDGFWFDVMVEDHGEGHGVMDYYHFTIRDSNGTVIYDTQGNQIGGNIQLHPDNPGHPATQSNLPSWVSLQP
jgi:hypothetical protein